MENVTVPASLPSSFLWQQQRLVWSAATIYYLFIHSRERVTSRLWSRTIKQSWVLASLLGAAKNGGPPTGFPKPCVSCQEKGDRLVRVRNIVFDLQWVRSS